MRHAAVIAVLALAASPLAGVRVSAAAERILLSLPSHPTLIAEGCGRHFHWVGRHRDRDGHWIRGHCVPNR